MEDCIFCKIVKGEIPCNKIYEDENVLAFLDISGKVVGHTLVIPKMHCENILDCQDNQLENIIKAVKMIANHYINDCGFSGFNLHVNNGKSAGQEVSHLHFHILPRGNNELKCDDLASLANTLKF